MLGKQIVTNYFSDMMSQIVETDRILPLLEYKYLDDLYDLYRIYQKQLQTPIFSKSRFSSKQLSQQGIQNISGIKTCQIFQSVDIQIQFINENFQVYQKYLFENFQLVGPVGIGQISLIQCNEHIITLSDDFLCVYFKKQALLYLPTQLLFGGLKCILHDIQFNMPGYLFTSIATSSSGQIFILSGITGQTFESIQGVHVRKQLICSLDYGNLFKFQFYNVIENNIQIFSNIVHGYRVFIYATYIFENKQQYIVLEIKPNTFICEINLLQSSQNIQSFNIEYISDLYQNIKTINGTPDYYNMMRSNMFTNSLSIFRKCIQSFQFLTQKQQEIEEIPSQLYYFDEINSNLRIAESKQIKQIQDFKITNQQKVYFNESKLTIPILLVVQKNSLKFGFNFIRERNKKCLDMQLSYSFYSTNNNLPQRQDLLNSFSNSQEQLEKETYLQDPIVLFIDNNIFIVSQNQKDVLTETLQIEDNYINAQIQIIPKVNNEPLNYNPFQQTQFIFFELNLSYYLLFDVKAHYQERSIEYYLFYLNRIQINLTYELYSKKIILELNSPIYEIQLVLQQRNLIQYKQKFTQLCSQNRLQVNKINYNEILINTVIQNNPEICFLISEIIKPESLLFLNLDVFSVLTQNDPMLTIFVVFQGIRIIGNFDIYLQYNTQILLIIDQILITIQTEKMLIQQDIKDQITQFLLIIDEFQIQLQLLKIFQLESKMSIEDFVDILVKNNRQFISYDEYNNLYQGDNVQSLQIQLDQYSKTAIYPNIQQKSKIWKYSVCEKLQSQTIRVLFVPSIQQQCNYYQYLDSQNLLHDQVTLNMIIILFTSIIEDNQDQKQWLCLESIMFSKKINFVQQYITSLVSIFKFNLQLDKNYNLCKFKIIILFVQSIIKPQYLSLASKSYIYSLIVLLDEIQSSKNQQYYDQIQDYIMYLQCLFLQDEFISYLDFTNTDIEVWLLLLVSNETQVDKISNTSVFQLCQGQKWENFLCTVFKTVANWDYLDLFLQHFINSVSSLDNIQIICQFIYQKLPLHSSNQICQLFDSIQQHIEISKVCYIFLKSNIPFCYDLINSQEKLYNLATQMNQPSTITQLKVILSLIDFPLARIQLLIQQSYEEDNIDMIKFYNEFYLVNSIIVAITYKQHLLSVKELAQIVNLNVITSKTIIYQLVILLYKFNKIELYQLKIDYNLPLYDLHQNLSYDSVIELIFNDIDQKQLIINILQLLPLPPTTKLLTLLNLHFSHLPVLFNTLTTQPQTSVSTQNFIFCSFEEIIKSQPLYESFTAFTHTLSATPLPQNYHFLTNFFRNYHPTNSFESTTETFDFYLPKLSTAQCLQLIESSFTQKIIFAKNAQIRPKTLPMQLIFNFLCESITTTEELTLLRLIFLNHKFCQFSLKTLIATPQEQLFTQFLQYATNNELDQVYVEFTISQINSNQFEEFLTENKFDESVTFSQFGAVLSQEFMRTSRCDGSMSALAISQFEGVFDAKIIEIARILSCHPDVISSENVLDLVKIQAKIEQLAADKKAFDVLELLKKLVENCEGIEGILQVVVQQRVVDKALDEQLPEFVFDEFMTKSIKSVGWETSEEEEKPVEGWKSDSESSVKNQWKSDSESDQQESEQKPEFYAGRRNHANLSVQTQIFIFKLIQENNYKIIEFSPDQLSVSIVLSLINDNTKTTELIYNQIIKILPPQTAINQLFDFADFAEMAEKNNSNLLSFFSPFKHVSFSIKADDLVKQFVENNSLNTPKSVIESSEILIDFAKIYNFSVFSASEFSILRNEKEAKNAAISMIFANDLDVGVCCFGGFKIDLTELVKASFSGFSAREIDFGQLIHQDWSLLTPENQIKIVFPLQVFSNETELIALIFAHLDENCSISLYRIQFLLLQLHFQKKLPTVVKNKIIEEVTSLQYFDYVIADNYAVFTLLDEEIRVDFGYLALGKVDKFDKICNGFDQVRWQFERVQGGIISVRFDEKVEKKARFW